MPRRYVRTERKPREARYNLRVLSPKWVDPYYWIQGSSIEKMVLAEFLRRGIYFEHTPQSNNLGGFVDPTWEADFWLPQYRIWIEIQGSYFHSLPGQIEADAWRFAALEHAGVRVLAWWEWDIRSRLQDLMNEVPEFYMVNIAEQKGYKTNNGLPYWEGGDGIDHLAGLRKALSHRAKPVQTAYRQAGRKRRIAQVEGR